MAKLISDMEGGVYPVITRGGLKCVLLPPGVRPTPLDEAQFEVLYRTLADTKRKVGRYERLINLTAGTKGTGNDTNLPTTDGLGVDAAQDGEVEVDGETLDPGRLSADELAQVVLMARDDDEAAKIVRHISQKRLAELCRELKVSALRVFDLRTERTNIRKEVIGEIEDTSTHEHMKYLQAEVLRTKDAYREEVETHKRLRVHLEASKQQHRPSSAASASLAVGGRIRPGTSGSHSASRGASMMSERR